MKRSQKIIQVLVAMLMVVGLLAPAAMATQPLNTAELQPALASLIAEAPDQLIRVIIQKADQSERVERLVAHYGGEIVKELDLINAVAAELPAQALPRLSQDRAVHLVSLDAPVRSASLLTETVRDNFDVRVYTNNDGTQPWSGPWVEINDDNEADGGKVKISCHSKGCYSIHFFFPFFSTICIHSIYMRIKFTC